MNALQVTPQSSVASAVGDSTPIVILGMHRSGTSALAKVMGRLGVWMGSAEFVSRRTEHVLLQACNQALLNGYGGHWSAPPQLGTEWVEGEVARSIDTEARRALDDLENHSVFAWKDPRTCFTLPYWRTQFQREPVALISYRHPLEVGASLKKRNDFLPGQVHALWESYNRALLDAVAGLRTVVVSYADLTRDPVATLEAVRASLAMFGIRIEGDPSDAAQDIEPDRRHHVFDELPDSTVTRQQMELWETLRALPQHTEHFVVPTLSEPHAASTELLAQRAATIRGERATTELQLQLRSRRNLARTFVRRLRDPKGD